MINSDELRALLANIHETASRNPIPEPVIYFRDFELNAIIRYAREIDGVLSSSLPALLDEVTALREMVYAPGHWVCRECGFYNLRSTINAVTGAIGVGSPASLCPNDGALMQPVPWREIAEDQRKAGEERIEEAAALRTEIGRWKQKYQQYADIWLMRGFPTKDDGPDLESTLVFLNSQNLLLTAEIERLREALDKIGLAAHNMAYHKLAYETCDQSWVCLLRRAALAAPPRPQEETPR